MCIFGGIRGNSSQNGDKFGLVDQITRLINFAFKISTLQSIIIFTIDNSAITFYIHT